MLYAGISTYLILLAALIGGLLVTYTNIRIHQKSAFQFRSLSNLLEAMIKGDYAMRARSEDNGSALNELVISINGLAERLSQQRRDSIESQLLLQTVIQHIDVAIIAMDQNNKFSLINPAAKNLLGIEQQQITPELTIQLHQMQQLVSGDNHLIDVVLGDRSGKFNVHVEEFREQGKQHKLLFITDVRSLLRSEERKAWQNLVRVISHEINNSLAPIASISQTLKRQISQTGNSIEKQSQTSQDLREGLTIILERATSLTQFIESYKQLAKLPEPKRQLVAIKPLIEKVIALFDQSSTQISIDDGHELTDIKLTIDPIQFEQVLINLTKNAIEAMAEQVRVRQLMTIHWDATGSFFKLYLCDRGTGINNPQNLFVPFYSTKKQGSGIGLVLSRQIIEAHHGQLWLENRKDGQGCCATIELPQD